MILVDMDGQLDPFVKECQRALKCTTIKLGVVMTDPLPLLVNNNLAFARTKIVPLLCNSTSRRFVCAAG